MRPSAVKKNTILFLSKVYSTRKRFISHFSFFIFCLHISKASCSRSLFRCICNKSCGVALRKTGLNSALGLNKLGCFGKTTTFPYSMPREVSTITSSLTSTFILSTEK